MELGKIYKHLNDLHFMVLEDLIYPNKAERRPWEMFFFGLIYATIGAVLALWIFRSQASMIMVLLTVVACIPLIYKTFKYEEYKDTQTSDERLLLKEHWHALSFLMYLFFGFIIAYAIFFIFLPQPTTEGLFNVQMATINQINAKITGGSIAEGVLFKIFFNNFKVLLFTILFAVFYGAGTIFILTWNASVIGAAIGDFVKQKVSEHIGYFTVLPLAVGRYMTHGFFEILAYFVGGLAGGIISVAIINKDTQNEKFKIILKDSFDLFLIAIAILIIAAFIEVFVTPLIYSFDDAITLIIISAITVLAIVMFILIKKSKLSESYLNR